MTESRHPLAVIIGISTYALPRLRLETPVRDAEALAALLEQRHGYEIRLVRDHDASKVGLLRLFNDELPAMLDEDRPVLIYFAGHGTAVDSLDQPRGYLVPVDGGGDLGSLLAMEDVACALAKLPSRHLLLLLDCCFAGAFRWSGGRDIAAQTPPVMYRERYQRFLATPAWQVITSAAFDEQAADVVGGLPIGSRGVASQAHSPFLAALLRGLDGAADAFPRRANGTAGDGVITATELYLYLRDEIEMASTTSRQTPGLWMLPKHRKGEYIFHVPSTTLTLPDAPTLGLDTSPYRGFFVYRENHAGLFHGRREVTKQLLARVEQQPINVVVASSGTGKSSLVLAGLVPALRKAHPTWRILPPMRPGTTPLATLEATLAAASPRETVVLIVDQLEELFSLAERTTEPHAFLVRLQQVVAQQQIRVVGTLRADLETALWSSPLSDTWDCVRFPLGDMTQDELREAIEIPAEQQALSFEPPELVDRLINTVVAMPGGLPLLSFTLHKLYVDCVARASNDRRLIEPRETGAAGIALALREHTDRLYARCDEATRATMRRMLLRMVSVKGGTIARRQLPLAELVFDDPAESARAHAVIDALSGRIERTSTGRASSYDASAYGLRLVVLGGSNEGGFIELAHDAVVRDWPQFQAWIRGASEGDLLLQRAVTVNATQWALADHHAGYLWRDDPRLELVQARLAGVPHALNRLEAAFVAASLAAARASRQLQSRARTRLFASVTLGIGLIATAVFLYLYRSREQVTQASAMAIRGATALLDRDFGNAELAYAASLTLRDDDEVRRALLHARGGRLHMSHSTASESPRLSAVSSDGAFYAMVTAPGRIEIGLVPSGQPRWFIAFEPSSDLESMVFGSGGSPGSNGLSFAYALNTRISVSTHEVHRVMVVRLDGAPGASDAIRTAVVSLGTTQRPTKRVSSMAFDPEATKLAIGSDDGSLGVYTISGTTMREYWFAPHAHTITVLGLAFRHDGAVLASGGGDYEIHLWWMKDDARRDDRLIAVLTGHQDSVFGVAFSPDGARLASGGYDRAIRVWDVSACLGDGCLAPSASRKLETIRILQGHSGIVLSLQFSTNGAMLASGGKDESIRLWDVDHARPVATLKPRAGALRSVAFTDFGKPIACGGDRGWVRWDPEVRNETRALWIDGSPVSALAIDPASTMLVAGTASGDLWSWRIADWTRGDAPLLHVDGGINGVAFSGDGRWLAAVGEAHRAHVWERDKQRPIVARDAWIPVPVAMAFHGPVWGIAFDPASRWFAAGGAMNDGHPAELRLWDTSTWNSTSVHPMHDVYSLAVVANMLISGDSNGELRAYSVPALTPVHTERNVVSGEKNVWGLATDVARQWVVSANSDGIVRVWDPRTDTAVAATEAREASANPTVNSVAFNRQRGTIAASGDGQQVVEYRIVGRRLEPIHRYFGQEGTVWMVTYSPDGRWLAYGGLDGFVRVIDLPAAEQILQADPRVLLAEAIAAAHPDNQATEPMQVAKTGEP